MLNRLSFFPEEDIMHFVISDGEEAGSVELSPNITAELDKKGEIIGMEILNASSYIRDVILNSAQARLLPERKPPTRKAVRIKPRVRAHVH